MKLLLLWSLMSAHAAPIKPPPKKSRVVVYERLAVDQAVAMLAARGIAVQRLTSPEASGLQFEINGITMWWTFLDAGTGVATEVFGYTVFELEQPVPLEKVNGWNAIARHTRAYINEQGQAVLECDLRLRGGVTEASVMDFVDTFVRSAAGFARHIGYR